MAVIHKQEVNIYLGDARMIEVPKGSKILRVSHQFDDTDTMIWYSVPGTYEGNEQYVLTTVGTGRAYPEEWVPYYIGTEIYHRGGLVLHFFAIPEEPK